MIFSGVPFPNIPQWAEKEVFQFLSCQDNDLQDNCQASTSSYALESNNLNF